MAFGRPLERISRGLRGTLSVFAALSAPKGRVLEDLSGRKQLDYWDPARRYLLSDPFLLSKLRARTAIEPKQRAPRP